MMTEEEVLACGPNFFRKGVPHAFAQFGIEVGEGWYPLVARMAQRIEALLTTDVQRERTYCKQIKQKFGSLRCSFAAYSLIHDDVKKIVQEASLESDRTCEYCGAEGKLRKTKYGYLHVVCKAHNSDSVAAESEG
jgi:hypothetical protein